MITNYHADCDFCVQEKQREIQKNNTSEESRMFSCGYTDSILNSMGNPIQTNLLSYHLDFHTNWQKYW